MRNEEDKNLPLVHLNVLKQENKLSSLVPEEAKVKARVPYPKNGDRQNEMTHHDSTLSPSAADREMIGSSPTEGEDNSGNSEARQ